MFDILEEINGILVERWLEDLFFKVYILIQMNEIEEVFRKFDEMKGEDLFVKEQIGVQMFEVMEEIVGRLIEDKGQKEILIQEFDIVEKFIEILCEKWREDLFIKQQIRI